MTAGNVTNLPFTSVVQSAAARLAVTVSTGEVSNREMLSALLDDLRSPLSVSQPVSATVQHQAGRLLPPQPEPQPEPEPGPEPGPDLAEELQVMSELSQFLSTDHLQRIQARRRAMVTGLPPFPVRGQAGGGTRAETLRLSPSSRESSYPTPSPPWTSSPPTSFPGR